MKLMSLFIGIGFLLLSVLLFVAANKAEAPAETLLDEQNTDVISEQEEDTGPTVNLKPDLIQVTSLTPGEVISSPLTITGEARGYWFFEASFPVILTKWDGETIAQGMATAEGDWMTEDFVPFTVTLEFESPYSLNDEEFKQNGTLIFEKDNPSGMPENADSLVFPIIFTTVS